jgi:hypothetical protein
MRENKNNSRPRPILGCYSVVAGLILIATVLVSVSVIWPAFIDLLARDRCSGPVKRVGRSVTCRDRRTGRDVTLGDVQLLACCPGAAVILVVLLGAAGGTRLVRIIEDRSE